MLVATNYFTKWVEAEDLVNIREYFSNLGIINRYPSPGYPQSNGQAKATNKTIVNGLKKRAKGN